MFSQFRALDPVHQSFYTSKIYLFFVARKPALQLYLKPGHKIGKPVPLFEKIEQSRLEELKKRFGGSQENPKQTLEQNSNLQSICRYSFSYEIVSFNSLLHYIVLL